MIRFENTVTIQRPPEEVFQFVANFENMPRWNYFVTDVSRVSGDMGTGTVYHQVRKTDQQDYEVIEYVPNQSVVVRATPESQPQFEMRFTLEAADGGTRLVDAWQLDSGRGGLLDTLATYPVKRAVAQNLDKLKELLETGQTRLQDGRRVTL